MLRTHTCNELTVADEGREITLCGWVHRRRDHGGMIFIDLRDRYGLTQVVSDPNVSQDSHRVADEVRPEFVLRITGKVRRRPEGMTNEKMKTGGIEVLVTRFEILNRSKTPPFEIKINYTTLCFFALPLDSGLPIRSQQKNLNENMIGEF